MGPRSTPRAAAGAAVARAAVIVIALATAACDGRPGPELRSADVAAPPPARVDACIPAADTAGAADRAAAGTAEGGGTADGAAPRGPTSWRVGPRDTLRGIAKRVYGDERFASEIARANPSCVGRDGALRAGTDLVLPWVVR